MQSFCFARFTQQTDGAVASRCEDLAQRIPGQTHVIMVRKGERSVISNFEAQDVDSSVQTPRTNVPAAEDRLPYSSSKI